MTINHIDHLVLTVADIEKTCQFYSGILSMEVITFGTGRKALRFGSQKINLHQQGKEIEPKAANPTPGSADICLIADTPIEKVKKELETKGIKLLSDIVERTGATGKIASVYFRDPDNNLIEVSNYRNG